MLKHFGSKRNYNHNVKLAALLSLTAGFVNAAGFLAFTILTTNVTGHAALFAENIASKQWQNTRVISLWMFLFLLGAFISSLCITLIGRNKRYSYAIPILIEIAVLGLVAFTANNFDNSLVSKEIFAGSLLFAMGLQNALVTVISGSVIRTTHLTGTFTDLGVELAQLLSKEIKDRSVMIARIKLRIVIIVFFMTGALTGAYLYGLVSYKAFWLPVVILGYVLLYDIFRIKIKYLYRTISRTVN